MYNISRFPLSKKPYQLKTSKKHTHIYEYVFAIFFSWLDFLVVKASFDVVPG